MNYQNLRLIAAAFAIVSYAPAQSFEEVRSSIRRQLVETKAPSLAVAVARHGKIVWEEGFGWADRENRVEATEHTMYSLASISKPFTATGVMVLSQSGKIDLDKPIDDYLGTARLTARVGDARDATVRRVASHSAGLPLHYQFFYADEPYQPPPMPETIRRYGMLVTAPGERYSYSNLGFGILDHVISRVSGRDYADFMRDQVFLPLDLTHTSVPLGAGLEKYAAVRYNPDGAILPFYNFDHPGGSAIWSSAHDLVRFGMFHLKEHLAGQKQILSDENIDEMQKPVIGVDADSGYGLGWRAGVQRGYRTVSHAGSMGGVRTILLMVPSERLAIVALCNTSSDLPSRIADEILAAALGLGAPSNSEGPRVTKAKFQPGPELRGTWSGKLVTHEAEHGLTLRILDSGDVHVQVAGQLKTLLNNPAFEDGFLTGQMMGDVGTGDASRRPHTIGLSLKLRGNVLNGGATALSIPGRRAGNALTSWVELRKE